MRHFALVNSVNETMDITTQSVLFHGISGLGFEEDDDFRQIGEFWWLNNFSYKQATISGNIIFTDNGGSDPYIKYIEFCRFISKQPLTLLYNPLGPIEAVAFGSEKDGETTYRRTVRVSKLEKSEKNEYGIIDEAIDFIAYTPWYIKRIKSIQPKEEYDQITGWIWAGTRNEPDPEDPEQTISVTYPPLVFEPEGTTLTVPDYSSTEAGATTTVTVPAFDGSATPTIFRYETTGTIEISLPSAVESPVKLTIFGPLASPRWTHTVINDDGQVITATTGSFNSNNIGLVSEDEYIVVDNTNGLYQIYKHNANDTITDLYAERDFGTQCFITLKEGRNRITVFSALGGLANNVLVEAHLYYATI